MDHESHGPGAGGKPAAILLMGKMRAQDHTPPKAPDEGMKVVARELAAALGQPGADIARLAKALRAAGRIVIMHESDEEASEKSEGA